MNDKDGIMLEKKKNKLIIVGCGELGQMAYEYFGLSQKYEPIAFAVEGRYKNCDQLCGIPVVEFETMDEFYSITEYEVFVAVTYVHLNEERKRLVVAAKQMGYKLASCVHSTAAISPQVTIGENVLVMENCVLQKGVTIGDGVIIWAGTVVAHGSFVGDFSWLAPRVAIAGFSEVGSQVFLGVNSTVIDKIKIVDKSVIGAGGVVNRSLMKSDVYVGCPVRALADDSYDKFYRG